MKIKDIAVNKFSAPELAAAGLNLHAVINLSDLPETIHTTILAHCKKIHHYTQLILIGHGGRKLWQTINKTVDWQIQENPIDNFSIRQATDFFSQRFSSEDFELIYPSNLPIGLQRLGEIAGWHHPSPFMVGINQQWGGWFAYRAVVLAKSCYQPTPKLVGDSPCNSCTDKICIRACPAKAASPKSFNAQACLTYRKCAGSSCHDRCLARMSCPIAKEHRYATEQINYHYCNSLKTMCAV